MKKLMSIFAACLFVFALASCGGDEASGSGSDASGSDASAASAADAS